MIFYKKIQKFQAITFDLDDTLYNNNSHMPVAEAAFLKDLHQRYPLTSELSSSAWRQHRHQALQHKPELQNDMGELRKHILTRVFDSLGFKGTKLQQAVEQSFASFYYHRSNFTIDKNIYSLLDLLAQRYPLVAITNGNVNLEQVGLTPYFRHTFKASLNKPMKPHRAMFDATKAALNLPSLQILHVGDSLHNDVYGAIQAGFQSAWYAHDRIMQTVKEPLFLLPHVQLNSLDELLTFDPLNLK